MPVMDIAARLGVSTVLLYEQKSFQGEFLDIEVKVEADSLIEITLFPHALYGSADRG